MPHATNSTCTPEQTEPHWVDAYFNADDAVSYYEVESAQAEAPIILAEGPHRIPGVLYGDDERRDYYIRINTRNRLNVKAGNWYPARSRFDGYSKPRIKNETAIYSVLGSLVAEVKRYPDRLDLLGELLRFPADLGESRLGIVGLNHMIAIYHNAISNISPAQHKPEWIKLNTLPVVHGYMPTTTDDGKIEFFASIKDMLTGKRTTTTPGRYLKRAYPTLPEHKVRDLATAHKLEYAEPVIKIARSESECIRAIADGPSASCMANTFHDAGSDWYYGHLHPAAVYGFDNKDPTWASDTEVLYIENDKGEIKARVICNAVTKACARIYGDEGKMRRGLTALGYTQSVSALAGAKIRAIEDGNGNGYLMPYVDAGVGPGGGSLNFKVTDGDYFLLCNEGSGTSTYCGYEKKGVTDGAEEDEEDEDDRQCDSCGDHYHMDDMTYTDNDDQVCESCLDRHYCYAVTSASGTQFGYIRDDDAVYNHSDGKWYHVDITSDNDVYACNETDEWYSIDDLDYTPYGYVKATLVVELDVEYDDCSYALPRHTVTTHGGQVIYKDAAVYDVFDNDIVYHEDDDLTVCGDQKGFTVASLFENLDRCSVLDGVLVLAKAERGAIPLREYMAIGHMCFCNIRTGFGRGFGYFDLTELHDLLTEEVETCDELIAA